MPVPDSPAPLRTALLRDSVHDRLRDAIVDGTLAPGEVVRDTELATWLGVSRTPVREALLRLGEAGLVRSAPGRSTVVAEIDLAEVREAHAVVAAMHASRSRRRSRGSPTTTSSGCAPPTAASPPRSRPTTPTRR